LKYILDVSKWRCGEDGQYRLHKGRTKMLNTKGYMCCLGQFAEQLGIDAEDLEGADAPRNVAANLGRRYDPEMVHFLRGGDSIFNTRLAKDLMDINDNEDDKPLEKIDNIRNRLEEEGHTLEVINENLLV